jgi:hypothetical protein
MNRRTFISGLTAAGTAIPFSGQALAEPDSGPGFHLGAVTYNTLKDFDVETIIRVLETAGFEGVELRTGHKHGVEPSISRDERSRVRRRFEQSMHMGIYQARQEVFPFKSITLVLGPRSACRMDASDPTAEGYK